MKRSVEGNRRHSLVHLFVICRWRDHPAHFSKHDLGQADGFVVCPFRFDEVGWHVNHTSNEKYQQDFIDNLDHPEFRCSIRPNLSRRRPSICPDRKYHFSRFKLDFLHNNVQTIWPTIKWLHRRLGFGSRRTGMQPCSLLPLSSPVKDNSAVLQISPERKARER